MSGYKPRENTSLNEVELSPTNSVCSDHLKKEDQLSCDSPSASSTSQFDLNGSISSSGFQSSNSSGNSTENQALQSLLRDKKVLSNGLKKSEKETPESYSPPLLTSKSSQLEQSGYNGLSSASFPSSSPKTDLSNPRQQHNQSNMASFSGPFQFVNEPASSNFRNLSKETPRQHQKPEGRSVVLPHTMSSGLHSEVALNQSVSYISNRGNAESSEGGAQTYDNTDGSAAFSNSAIPQHSPTANANLPDVYGEEMTSIDEVNEITINGEENVDLSNEQPQPTPEDLRENAEKLEQAAKSSSGLFLRLVFCFIAVTIAWASSMSVARFFAETIVPAPQWAFVRVFFFKVLRVLTHFSTRVLSYYIFFLRTAFH